MLPECGGMPGPLTQSPLLGERSTVPRFVTRTGRLPVILDPHLVGERVPEATGRVCGACLCPRARLELHRDADVDHHTY